MLSLLAVTATSTAIHVLLAVYVWRRLVRDTGLRRPWRAIATVVIVVMETTLPVTLLSLRRGPTALAKALAWPAFVWLGLFGLTVIALLAIDAARAIAWIGRRGAAAARRAPVGPADPSRRLLLARIGGTAAIAVATGEVAVGMRAAIGVPDVKDVPITLARLPAALDGFTIVQITDVHVGLTIGREFMAALVARVNALDADVIAITGDLVDGPASDHAGDIAPLAGLRARHGVFFTTGNHEYYAGVEAWLPVIADLGITILRNQRVALADGLDLAGIDDHSAKSYGHGHGADLAAALDGRDPDRALVLMAHQPRQVDDASAAGVDLQLSGHTHGGQIWPWHHVVALQQEGMIAGRYTIGDTQLYVSRGVGYWGPPVRVGAPAEIARVILRSAG